MGLFSSITSSITDLLKDIAAASSKFTLCEKSYKVCEKCNGEGGEFKFLKWKICDNCEGKGKILLNKFITVKSKESDQSFTYLCDVWRHVEEYFANKEHIGDRLMLFEQNNPTYYIIGLQNEDTTMFDYEFDKVLKNLVFENFETYQGDLIDQGYIPEKVVEIASSSGDDLYLKNYFWKEHREDIRKFLIKEHNFIFNGTQVWKNVPGTSHVIDYFNSIID